MALAERLALAQLGATGMNPAVGAVVVKNGVVIGRGATMDGGRPHAERVALDQAGARAKGADVYVSLEPCAHHGGTPPCADALVEAGVARVICPWRDPFPKVDNAGFARLEEAGIELVRMRRALGDPLRYFFTNQVLKRPFVALKLATSLDGKIALQNGESQWISGVVARRFTRALRARYHAIGVGLGTVLQDDPQLTTRLEGLRDPRPVVFDSEARTPRNARVFAYGGGVLVSKRRPEGVEANWVEHDPRDLVNLMPKLLEAGVSSLLLEGGGELAASFARANLLDRIYHVSTGALMGADARAGLGALGLEVMEDVARPKLTMSQRLGEDVLVQFDFDDLDVEPLRA